MHKTGIALLEVVIVLGLCMLTALYIYSCRPLLNTSLVRLEVERLYSLIISLQQKARITKITHVISFNNEHASYYYNNKHNYTLMRGVCFGIKPDTKGPPAKPHEIITRPITFQNNQLVIYPDGTTSAGVLYLTDTNRSCLYAISCAVSPYASIFCYIYSTRDAAWHLL